MTTQNHANMTVANLRLLWTRPTIFTWTVMYLTKKLITESSLHGRELRICATCMAPCIPWTTNIRSLACSSEKFKRVCQINMQCALLPSVIRKVYEGTAPSDKPLRNILVNTLCRSSSHFELNQEALEAFEASHSFASDAALTLLKDKQSQSHGG